MLTLRNVARGVVSLVLRAGLVIGVGGGANAAKDTGWGKSDIAHKTDTGWG